MRSRGGSQPCSGRPLIDGSGRLRRHASPPWGRRRGQRSAACGRIEPPSNGARRVAAAKASPSVAVPDPIYGKPLAPGMMKLLQNEIVDSLRARGNVRRFRPLPELCRRAAQSDRRRVHRFGVDGQLPPELVRSYAPQSAEGPGRSRGVHAAAAQGDCGRSVGAGSGVGDGGGEARSRQAQAAGVHPRPLAARGVGSGQAALDRGPGGLRRRIGAAEQGRNPGIGIVSLSGAGGPEHGGPHAQRSRHRPAALRLDGEDGPRRADRRGRGPGAASPIPSCSNNQRIARRRRRVRAGRDGPRGGEDRHPGRGDRHRRQGQQHLSTGQHARRGRGDRPGRRRRLLRGHGLARAARAAGHRPGGGNHFQASKPGVQGGAILGVSMLLDLAGQPFTRPRTWPRARAWPASASSWITAATTAIAASAACKGRPWAASAC